MFPINICTKNEHCIFLILLSITGIIHKAGVSLILTALKELSEVILGSTWTADCRRYESRIAAKAAVAVAGDAKMFAVAGLAVDLSVGGIAHSCGVELRLAIGALEAARVEDAGRDMDALCVKDLQRKRNSLRPTGRLQQDALRAQR